MRYLSTGNFAYRRLEDARTADRTFDRGSGKAFTLLTEAHELMAAALEKAMCTQLQHPAGVVREEDSRNALGIQVADVAAGLAAREYEAAPGDTPSKARRLRAFFDRVLLNDEWV